MTTNPELTLREWLAAEPFTLSLSAGFFGFFAHCGVLTALVEADLIPKRASGASAGALVSGFFAAGMTTEEMQERVFALRKSDFWDPGIGFGLLRGRKFRALLEESLPVERFEDCRVPLAISTFDVLRRRTRVFDAGPLAPAIQASCSLPFLFQPVWIGRRPFLDGGVRDRPALDGVPAGERVLHHHLISRRERERRKSSPPTRDNMTTLILVGLPRVHPDHLDRGPKAFETARGAMRRALDRPTTQGLIEIDLDAD